MMTNLAIVVAVSDYPGGNELPACVHDGHAIAKVLEAEPRFSDVLLIDSETRSATVKAKIIDFITKHKGETVGDFVFYFSGHGDFSGDDFYYLLTDFDNRRRKQTALENSELDNLTNSSAMG